MKLLMSAGQIEEINTYHNFSSYFTVFGSGVVKCSENKVSPCHQLPLLYGIIGPSIKCEKVDQYSSMLIQL